MDQIETESPLARTAPPIYNPSWDYASGCKRLVTVKQRYKSAFLSVAAVIAAISNQGVLWAQNCGDLPSRADVSQQKLAVKLSGNWKFFAPNPTGPAHLISVAGAQTLCLAWEAPPYPRNQKQIVYASTQYRGDQPIWLWRNSAFQIPIIGALIGDWNRTPDSSGRDPRETFTTFHRSLPGDVGAAPWRILADWHDTSAWLPNQSSYDVVSAALRDAPDSLPCGTERLLALAAARPLSSWVPFTTRTPTPQDRLHVVVAFSGDLDSLGLGVYLYTLDVQ